MRPYCCFIFIYIWTLFHTSGEEDEEEGKNMFWQSLKMTFKFALNWSEIFSKIGSTFGAIPKKLL